ncbi:MAG: efflux RND transporter periplasmic adaptor subunit [Bacteroidetes bacterium]|nr:efflux RND transporter periplasmic adaptor subunit [Bacteroidota bacterium]
MKNLILFSLLVLAVASCSKKAGRSDAYGNFETCEVTVSSEAQGRLIRFIAEEGLHIKAGDTVGLIDTLQLSLKMEQLLAQKTIIVSKSASILSQIEVLEEQKNTLLKEKARLEKLIADGAAPTKQIDDVNGQLNVLDRQINSILTQNSAALNELKIVDIQIRQLKDQLSKCYIINPIYGTVLEKYTEQTELAIPGKILYKIADLTELELRVYVSGDMLPHVKIDDEVEVLIDSTETENSRLTGTVSWISPQAEFTPKLIQTKEERVNLVYAVKIRVKNDGRLKIGMPGEINFKYEQ